MSWLHFHLYHGAVNLLMLVFYSASKKNKKKKKESKARRQETGDQFSGHPFLLKRRDLPAVSVI